MSPIVKTPGPPSTQKQQRPPPNRGRDQNREPQRDQRGEWRRDSGTRDPTRQLEPDRRPPLPKIPQRLNERGRVAYAGPQKSDSDPQTDDSDQETDRIGCDTDAPEEYEYDVNVYPEYESDAQSDGEIEAQSGYETTDMSADESDDAENPDPRQVRYYSTHRPTDPKSPECFPPMPIYPGRDK